MIGRLHSLIERVVAGGMDSAVFQTWTTPRTWVAGELVTAALLNTHIRDNENTLRAGGLALSSQAANDFLYASSASQFGRVAAVDGKVPRYTTALGWGMSSAACAPYAVTMTDVVSTNVETDFFTFTIPAGEWGDKERVVVMGYILHKNNSGGGATLSPKIYVGGVMRAAGGGVSFTNSINETPVPCGLVLMRSGANVAFLSNFHSGAGVALDALQAGEISGQDWALYGSPNPVTEAWTPNFAANIIIKMSVTPSASSSSLYVKPRGFIAHRFGS